MTLIQYYKLLKAVCGEELERLEEFLYSVNHDLDCSEDKPWTTAPEFIPSYEDVVEQFKDSNYNYDEVIAKIDKLHNEGFSSPEEQEEAETLEQDLRDLMLG